MVEACYRQGRKRKGIFLYLMDPCGNDITSLDENDLGGIRSEQAADVIQHRARFRHEASIYKHDSTWRRLIHRISGSRCYNRCNVLPGVEYQGGRRQPKPNPIQEGQNPWSELINGPKVDQRTKWSNLIVFENTEMGHRSYRLRR